MCASLHVCVCVCVCVSVHGYVLTAAKWVIPSWRIICVRNIWWSYKPIVITMFSYDVLLNSFKNDVHFYVHVDVQHNHLN